MVVPVAEIVDVVPGDRVDAVVQRAFHRSLAGSGEIRLQSGRPRVQNADFIRVISPRLPECLLERPLELFEWVSFGLTRDTHLEQLSVRYVSAQHRLHHVGSVQTVHAVDTHVALLFAEHLACLVVDFVPLLHAAVQSGQEVLEVGQFVLDYVSQFGQILPPHLPALVVEIEPHVKQLAVLHVVDQLSELSADP